MKKNIFQKNLSFTISSLLIASVPLLAESKEKNQIDSVTVIADKSSHYITEGKPSLNRSNLNIEDMAKSVQVYSEEFISDSQVQNIQDIIKMSSNTVYTGDTDGKSTNISMRGFSGVPILLDGLKITNQLAHPEIFNFDAVEIQKGPDSLQYGSSSPGGIVNLVTKKPIKKFLGNMELEVNDNPSYSPRIDLGGSINESETLYFRFVSAFKHDEGWTNSNTDTNRVFISPSLSYDINDNHTLTFISQYTHETGATSFGTNVNSKGELVAPIDHLASHPDEEFKNTQKIFGFDLKSNFESWNSNLKYRYTKHIRDYGDVYLPLMYNETTNSVIRFPAEQRQEFSENALQYTLNKTFSLFNLENNLSIGTDYNKAYSQTKSRVAMDPHTINLKNPSYEKHIKKVSDYSVIRDMSREKSYIESWGGFIQNNINISENLIVNAALRYSESKPQNGQRSDALNPSFGVVYKLTPQTSIYTNYSESFTPNTVTNTQGEILDPEEAQGYELGIKQKLLDDNFHLTAAIFKIDKKNIALADGSTLDPNDYTASGQQISKGIELDLSGKITQNLSMIASYGYTTTKNKDNNNLQLRNIPKHTANLFTTYHLTSFNLPNVYVGGGARYIGSRYSDDANTIKFNSEIIYNATVGYEKNNWKASLSIHNLTDESYVDGSASGTTSDTRVYVGTPRTILARLSYRF